MSSLAHTSDLLRSEFAQLSLAREILHGEGTAILQLASTLDGRFCDAIRTFVSCRGSVIVTGMGKAGLVGQKIAATFASTGTPSHFVHPAEAIHGDLGRIRKDDVTLILSNSGETDEILRLLPSLVELSVTRLAITSHCDSTLGRESDVVLEIGDLQEACPIGMAPSTTTTVMLAIGDALALVTSQLRGFQKEDFGRFHPGGSLGRNFTTVEEVMRPLSRLRIASQEQTVRQVITSNGTKGRRSGAIMLTDQAGRLRGIFTDSDLARLFESRRDAALDEPICQVMSAEPKSILEGTSMPEATDILAENHISELPVVDKNGYPIGLIDITDVLRVLPHEEENQVDHGRDAPYNSEERTPTIPFSKRLSDAS